MSIDSGNSQRYRAVRLYAGPLGGSASVLGLKMGRRKQDRLAVGVKERAGAPALAGADHPGRRVLRRAAARKIWYPSSSGLGW